MAKFPGTAEVRTTALVPTLVHVEIDKADPAATYTVPVKAGTFVHSVGVVIKEAFNGAGCTLIVGDGADDDGYLDTTDVAVATAATATVPTVKLSRNSSNPYANGKYYAADDTIDFVFAPGTTPTTGKLKGFVIMSSVRNDGIDA